MSGKDGTSSAEALADAISTLLVAPLQVVGALVSAAGSRQSVGCEIPPPCWEPRPAGTCCLVLTPGATGQIRVHVANCGWDRHAVVITALGKLAGWLTFSPTTLVLDAQERASFDVTVHPTKEVQPGQELTGTILVRGCRDHAIKVEVLIRDCARQTCCDVSIDDCPDHVHHWYDHFYCPRPCRTSTLVRANDG